MSVNECNAALLSVAGHFEFVREGVAQCCALSSDRQAGHLSLLSRGVKKSQLAGNSCSFTLTPAGILDLAEIGFKALCWPTTLNGLYTAVQALLCI